MESTIFSTLNSSLLASASVKFCNEIGIEVTDELVAILSQAVMCALARWYNENGKEFDLATSLVEPDAVAYAFERMHEIASLAYISATTGIDMDRNGFGE